MTRTNFLLLFLTPFFKNKTKKPNNLSIIFSRKKLGHYKITFIDKPSAIG